MIAVRMIACALWADALLTIAITLGGSAAAASTWDVGSWTAEAKLATSDQLRALPWLPADAVGEFLEQDTITMARLEDLTSAQRAEVNRLLDRYDSHAARAAVVSAVIGWNDEHVWWTSGGMILLALLVTFFPRHRSPGRPRR